VIDSTAMSTLSERLADLPTRFANYVDECGTPGGSLAVRLGNEQFETASGVVNIDTGVEATPDSVFQIGSVTKVFTTTLMMQLVDEGLVELDELVRCYLPEFGLGDTEAVGAITVRHLLTHQSGMDGDFFQDTGGGDDAVERYVLACRGLGQLHAPGHGFSYCNAGFMMAGRIIEKLRGTTWDCALHTHLLKPLGIDSLHTKPEWALYYRAAIGHVANPENGQPMVAPIPFLPQSNGPAGATPFAKARDLLTFAAAHIDGGGDVLSADSVRQMQQLELQLPEGSRASSWGLGWMRFDWSGRHVIGHDGATFGQFASLRIVPDANVSVSLGDHALLSRLIMNDVLGELCDIELPALPEPSSTIAVDHDRYTGTYERFAERLVVEPNGEGLILTKTARFPAILAVMKPLEPVALEPVNESLFLFADPASRLKTGITFLDFDDGGRSHTAYTGTRIAPRTN